MTTRIDHAMRAREALLFLVKHYIREHLDRRKGRNKSPDYAAYCLRAAKQHGASLNHFRQLIRSEIHQLTTRTP